MHDFSGITFDGDGEVASIKMEGTAATGFIAEADQRVDEAITAGDWLQAREAVSYALWRVESQLGDVEALRPIAAQALAAFAKDPLPDGPIGTAWRSARGGGASTTERGTW